MCTVTYLPTGENTFILTSNRDESPSRGALQLTKKQLPNNLQILFPKDPKAGGTWIATGDNNKLLVLLNGAFERHKRNLPYRRSRGLVVLDFFSYKTADEFIQHYDFENIEPFTMVIYSENKLTEFRWDEKQKYIRSLATDQAYIWSSAPLYTPKYQKIREILFQKWLLNYPTQNYTPKDSIQFHQSGGTGSPANDFVMNRLNIVRTISITCIEKQANQFTLQHQDLLHNNLLKGSLALA